jgi:hypothetical protein
LILGLSVSINAWAAPQSCYYPSVHTVSPASVVQKWVAYVKEHTNPVHAVNCAKRRFDHLKRDIFDYQRRAENPMTRAFLKPNEFERSRALLINQFADDIELLLDHPEQLSEQQVLLLHSDIFEITTKILQGKGQLANLDVVDNKYLVGATRIVSRFNELKLGEARAYTLDNDMNYHYYYFVVAVYRDSFPDHLSITN